MAVTLTKNYQLLSQVYVGQVDTGTIKNVYLRGYARYDSQSTSNNNSVVFYKTTLYVEGRGTYFYTGATTKKSISASGVNYQEDDAKGNYYLGETTLYEKSATIQHGEDGKASVNLQAVWLSSPWSISASLNVNADLPTIKRLAITNSVTGDNIEDNFKIDFTKYVDNYNYKLRISIPNVMELETVDYNTSNEEIKISEESKINLYNHFNATNDVSLGFAIETYDGDTLLSQGNEIIINLKIKEANPIFNDFEFKDVNEKTVNLTGNNQDVIIGFSNVQITIPVESKAIAQKEAIMRNYRFNNIQKEYSDAEDVEIISNQITTGEMIVYAIDSRQNSTSKIKSAVNVINYIELAKQNELIAKRQNGVSENVEISFSGKVNLINFGAITNSIKKAQYRFKVASENEWSEYNNLQLTIDDNGNFNFNGLIIGDTDELGFNLNNAYNIEVLIEDELSKILYTANLGSGIPHIAYAKNGVGIMGKYNESEGGLLQVGGKKINNPKVFNEYTNSQTNVYSCEYINKLNAYSTEEQIIGKWRDGKTLYRKTYINFDYVDGEQFDDITFETNTNMNIKRSYGHVVLSGFKVNVPTPNVGFGAISNVNQNPSGLIYMNRTHGGYGTLQSLEVTVEYTKTTD